MESRKKYVRLKPEIWVEIDALWQSGGYTLEELAARFAITERALQYHFKREGVVKGALAEAIAVAAHQAVVQDEIGDHEKRVVQSRMARAEAMADSDRIQSLLRQQVLAIALDSAQAFKLFSAIKALNVATLTLERLQSIKTTALAIEPREGEELPVIQFLDLSDEDIKEIQKDHGSRSGDDDDDDSREWSEEDDGVFETHE
jgi:hypothetical protein